MFFLDDRLLLGVWYRKNVQFFPLFDHRLVALAIPFDDGGVLGLHDTGHWPDSERRRDAREDNLAHFGVSPLNAAASEMPKRTARSIAGQYVVSVRSSGFLLDRAGYYCRAFRWGAVDVQLCLAS